MMYIVFIIKKGHVLSFELQIYARFYSSSLSIMPLLCPLALF